MSDADGAQVPAVRPDDAMTTEQVVGQVRLISEVQAAVMKKDTHFGIIPGCKNPSLYKAGAEKLCLTFRLAPRVTSEAIVEMKGNHREYRIQLGLYKIGTDNVWAEGVGSCSTMESKYRYRTGPKNVTDRPVPQAYWTLRNTNPEGAEKLIGKGNSTKKVDNKWFITEGGGERVEHDNPADYWNTCYKMAYKRALISATLAATGASDLFTQDVEDMPGFAKEAPAPTEEPEKPVETQKPPAEATPPKEEAKPEPSTPLVAPGELTAQEKLYKELALRSGCNLDLMEKALRKFSSFKTKDAEKGIVLHEPEEGSPLTNIWNASDKWCNTTIGKLRKSDEFKQSMAPTCAQNDDACDHAVWHDGDDHPRCGETLVACPYSFGKDKAPF